MMSARLHNAYHGFRSFWRPLCKAEAWWGLIYQVCMQRVYMGKVLCLYSEYGGATFGGMVQSQNLG